MKARLLLTFTLALIVLTALLLGGAGLINYTLENCTRSGGGLLCNTPAPCYEDQPCWDCKSMGNLLCGKEN